MKKCDKGDNEDYITEQMVDQLRLPLTQIRQLLERGDPASLQSAAIISAQSLRALDAYVLTRQPNVLRFEPISVGSMLYDVAHELSPLAKQYGRHIQLDNRARFGSLLTDRQYLHQLLGLVGEIVIKMPHAKDNSTDIILGTHSSQRGVVAGAFLGSGSPQIKSTIHNFVSWQQQASVEVAGLLAERLKTVLRAYRHYTMPGIGVRLEPSKQLRLWV